MSDRAQIDLEIPDTDVTSFVLEHAAERGDAPALIDGPTGRTITYAEFAQRVRSMAAGLDAKGFVKGDTMAVFLPNMPEYALAFHAVASVGGRVTTLNPLYTAYEVAHQLRDSGACSLLTIPPLLDTAREAAAEAGVKNIVVIGDAPEGTMAFTELFGDPEAAPEVDIDPAEDLAVLPYSSGTTGLPKGVMLTHRNLVANLVQVQTRLHLTPGSALIGVLPFFHIYGMTVIMNLGLRQGATIVTMPRFDLEQFLDLLEQHRVTHAYIVPPIALALAKHPAVDEHDLSSLELIMSGAAPFGAELTKAVAERVNATVMQGYGLTETSPVTHCIPPGSNKPGSIGPPLPATECRVVDPVSGKDVPDGERGELWICGPQVMRGYLNNPQATAATIDADGWLHTGDIAVRDTDGYFEIVDRLKELIKYKGFQVAPAELEALLITHPAVADVAVIGVPDEECGELPKAFVVPSGDELAPEELMAWVAERVAPQKRVRLVEVTEAIPKSPSGKILRRKLVELERERAASA
jgi:acyl-CoA synthetase (AMP-forming)/AMP-acid ligase II